MASSFSFIATRSLVSSMSFFRAAMVEVSLSLVACFSASWAFSVGDGRSQLREIGDQHAFFAAAYRLSHIGGKRDRQRLQQLRMRRGNCRLRLAASAFAASRSRASASRSAVRLGRVELEQNVSSLYVAAVLDVNSDDFPGFQRLHHL